MDQKNIDIILPAYHEQDNIKKVIEGIEKHVKTPHKITVVIQEKKDPTIDVLKKLKKEIKTLNIIYTKDGKGIVKALNHGFKNTNASIVTVMMSDLSDNPKDIDNMIKKINQGYDLVCASRYSNSGKRLGGPKFKGFLSYFGCISLMYLTGIPTKDATNAFKTYRRTIIKQINIKSKQGFEIPLELTVKAHYLGFNITEVPTIWKDRKKGKSQFELWKNVLYYLRWYFFGIIHNFLRH